MTTVFYLRRNLLKKAQEHELVEEGLMHMRMKLIFRKAGEGQLPDLKDSRKI